MAMDSIFTLSVSSGLAVLRIESCEKPGLQRWLQLSCSYTELEFRTFAAESSPKLGLQLFAHALRVRDTVWLNLGKKKG